jgi:ABC-type Fe3+-hydroxamate transport system substrate-binding protein
MPLHTTLDTWPKEVQAHRIVSLVPSISELLFDLGLDERVVGITKFCVHPKEWFKIKKRVGGTKTVKPDKIRELAPDMVIANLEENVEEQVMEIASFCHVFLTDIKTLEDALKMIEDIGTLTGTFSQATIIRQKIEKGFAGLTRPTGRMSALYLIWRNPFMAAGGDTFISNLMEKAGFSNVVSNLQRYPMADPLAFRENPPDVVFLSSEPYPFGAKHLKEIGSFFPDSRIELVDGEIFSWYGSRLIHAPAYFCDLMQRLKNIR